MVFGIRRHANRIEINLSLKFTCDRRTKAFLFFPVRGGRVYGRWPGLDQSQLNEGRDLALTTDFRRVLGEAVSRHLGNANLTSVFPSFDNSPQAFLRYLG